MCQPLFEFGPRHYQVDLPMGEVRLRRAESRGQFLSCWSARSPGREGEKSARLGKDHVRKRAKLASTSARGGRVSTEMNGRPLRLSDSRATTVFAICISERIPSCMRAPPDAATTTSGTPSSTARAHRRAKSLTHHRAHGPARKRKSIDTECHAPVTYGTPACQKALRTCPCRPAPSESRSTYGRISRNDRGSDGRDSSATGRQLCGSASCTSRSAGADEDDGTSKWADHSYGPPDSTAICTG